MRAVRTRKSMPTLYTYTLVAPRDSLLRVAGTVVKCNEARYRAYPKSSGHNYARAPFISSVYEKDRGRATSPRVVACRTRRDNLAYSRYYRRYGGETWRMYNGDTLTLPRADRPINNNYGL